MIYALDSNIISYILKGNKNVKENFTNAINNNNFFSIPPLVYYEVKRWLTLRNANVQLKEFTKLYQDSVKSEMNLKIWEKAIELYVNLRLKGSLTGDSDIFIAAFCIVNDYVLVTNNTKHFEIVKGLKTKNWKD